MSLETTARILQELKDLAQSMVTTPSAAAGRSAKVAPTGDENVLHGSSSKRAQAVPSLSSHAAQQQNAPTTVVKHTDPTNTVTASPDISLVTESVSDRSVADALAPTQNPAGSLITIAKKWVPHGRGQEQEKSHNEQQQQLPPPPTTQQQRQPSQQQQHEQHNTSVPSVVSPGDRTPPVDMDGSTFDGVKTLVLFLNSDPERFEQLARSMWAPEDVEAPVTEDASEDEDLAAWLRVPSFPFGGGVTDAQARYLFHKYCELRLASKGTSPKHYRRGGPPQQHAHSHSHSHNHNHRHRIEEPARITLDAFRNRAYREALVGSDLKNWRPDSISDYFVEVEPDVVFDAHTAKAARRLQLTEAMASNGTAAMAGVIQLRVIMDPLKTGFEEDKEYNIQPGQVVANRFQIVDLLGSATFSRAVRAYDLHQPVHDETGCNVGFLEVCLKIINNSKEFFDQSLDEIRLLQLINSKADPDDAHVLRLIDFFYYKEHTFLVTELLSDNLYEYAKFNREHESEFYFTIPRLKSLARQILTALAYIHSLNLMHCDLKPENILFVSHRRCIVKVIDFGSSCFLSDHLSSYIQSRSYRAPEVVLGADYDGRIDVWSVGAILAELVTGDVLFTSETVPEMLARIVAICGQPLPRAMLWEGRHTQDFVTKFGCIYETGNKERDENAEDSYYMYTPIPLEFADDGTPLPDAQLPYAMLRAKLAAAGMTDPQFVDFVQQCLTLDHHARPTAQDLLGHPFLFVGDDNDEDVQNGEGEEYEEDASSIDEDITDIEPEHDEDDEDGGEGRDEQ